LTKLKLDEWEVKLIPFSKPKEAVIELTMQCNLKCIHCYRNTCNEPFGSMNEKTYTKILLELKENDVKKIWIYGWGEPFLHPRILDFMEIAKNYGFYVAINTNGTLIDDDIAEFLVKQGIDEIAISIDSAFPEKYEKIRIGGKLIEVYNNITRIVSAKRRHDSLKPKLGVVYTVNSDNLYDIFVLADQLSRMKVAYILISNLIPTSKDMAKTVCYYNVLSKEVINKIRYMAFIKGYGQFISIVLPEFTLRTQRMCPFIENKAVFIRWDGGVTPCLYYAHNQKTYIDGIERHIKAVIFGNINNESLINIWRSREFTEFRFRTKVQYYPSCFDCIWLEWCDLTRSNELDCWGNSPTCAHCPFARRIAQCPL